MADRESRRQRRIERRRREVLHAAAGIFAKKGYRDTTAKEIAEAMEIGAIFKSDVSGVVDASLIGFRKNKAEYSLKYRGWPEQLLNEIQMSYFKNKYFEPVLESIKGNQIIITK